MASGRNKPGLSTIDPENVTDSGELTPEGLAQHQAALAADLREAGLDPDTPEFDEGDEIISTFINRRVTIGRDTTKPGEVHLEREGDFFIARFLGLRHPKAFDDGPILTWEMLYVGGVDKPARRIELMRPEDTDHRYYSSQWWDVWDKLVEGFPINRSWTDPPSACCGMCPVFTHAEVPPVVKVTYLRTEPLPPPKKGTIKRFRVSPINLRPLPVQA